ncbi:MAG: type IV toxin-antitoxin system AbiEi family antitoxin domain-containing protein, partial [Actinomycetota bacterium]
RPPIGARLSAVAESQRGYFTRAQAVRVGVGDMALQRGLRSGVIERLNHGVYRIAGAGYDPHQQLRVAWLRLTPELSARERTLKPHLWVSHRSVAALLDLGVTIADVPEFISDQRLQTRANVDLHLRSGGLNREDWTVHDGFAVTTPARTIADLAADHMDGGHLGRIAADALARGLTTEAEVDEALEGRVDLAAILELATGKMR